MYLNYLARFVQWSFEPFCSVSLSSQMRKMVPNTGCCDIFVLLSVSPVPERWAPFHGNGLCYQTLVIDGSRSYWLHRMNNVALKSQMCRVWLVSEHESYSYVLRVALPEVIERNLIHVLSANLKDFVCHDFLELLIEGAKCERPSLSQRNEVLETFNGVSYIRFFSLESPELSHSALRLGEDVFLSKMGEGPFTVSSFNQLTGVYYYTTHHQQALLVLESLA